MAGRDANGVPGMSYARWVRQAMARVRMSSDRVVTLFDSSVPEPVELLRETIAAGFSSSLTSRYTSAFVDGNPFVIDTLAARYDAPRDHIFCTTGATSALSLIYRAQLDPGGRVLVERPGFDLFHGIADAYGHGIDYFDRAGPRFAFDPDEVAARIGPRTRLVVLSDLHNPSGMALGHAELEALGRIAEAKDVLVVVDEVYGDYADRATRPCIAAAISPRMISVNSLSKVLGLSTLRCGWIVAAPDVLAPIRRLSEEIEFGVSNLAHAVAALVLEHYDDFLAYSTEMIARSRPVIEARYAAWRRDGLIEGELPDFGCIFFPRLVGIEDSEAFSVWLADRCGVIVAPGEFFGAPGRIRIGYAQPPDALEHGLDALTDGLSAYRESDALVRHEA